tara:strand:- start:436 stop:762 length:327 start_codon:yes stop_codon:yes gene_type:complete
MKQEFKGPKFFKMLQNGNDIYGFVKATKSEMNGKKFALRIKDSIINMNVLNPIALYNDCAENGISISDAGLINRFEIGELEDLKKGMPEANFLERIKINGLEYDVYQT